MGCSRPTPPPPEPRSLNEFFAYACEHGKYSNDGLVWEKIVLKAENRGDDGSPLGEYLVAYCIADRPIRYFFDLYEDNFRVGPKVRLDGPTCFPLSDGALFCPNDAGYLFTVLSNQSCDTMVAEDGKWNLKWDAEKNDISRLDMAIAAVELLNDRARLVVPVNDSCWLRASYIPNQGRARTR